MPYKLQRVEYRVGSDMIEFRCDFLLRSLEFVVICHFNFFVIIVLTKFLFKSQNLDKINLIFAFSALYL